VTGCDAKVDVDEHRSAAQIIPRGQQCIMQPLVPTGEFVLEMVDGERKDSTQGLVCCSLGLPPYDL
jgi:hypothetical protein